MVFPDLSYWNCVFYSLIIIILTLPFLYDKGKEVLTYHGKFLFYYFVVSLSAVGFTFLFIFNAKNVKNCWYAADLLKNLSKVLNIKWELRDMENMIKDGAVIIANHQSSLDLLGMFQIWRTMGKVTAIAKKELFYFWPFGLCAWLAGVVFIDRNNPSKSYRILQKTSTLMQRDETKLFFFPEGTRNIRVNKTRKLLPFKKGAFKMAISCQVPILPIVFSPYYFIDSDARCFGTGRMIIKALPPIPTKNLTDEDLGDLMKRANEAMTKAFEELFDEVAAEIPENHHLQKSDEKRTIDLVS